MKSDCQTQGLDDQRAPLQRFLTWVPFLPAQETYAVNLRDPKAMVKIKHADSGLRKGECDMNTLRSQRGLITPEIETPQ